MSLCLASDRVLVAFAVQYAMGDRAGCLLLDTTYGGADESYRPWWLLLCVRLSCIKASRVRWRTLYATLAQADT